MKKNLLLIMMLVVTISAMGQATSLVVDNQTPGWLSSKINYGDQLTLINLKVTGYINETDLKFIGSLMKRSLNGVLDLTDASVVNCKAYDSDSKEHDNYIGNTDGRLMKGSLKHYLLPQTLKQPLYGKGGGYAFSQILAGLTVDTLTIGGNNVVLFSSSPVTSTNRVVGVSSLDDINLIIRDKVKEIWDGDLANDGSSSLKSINLPPSLKYIGCRAISGHKKMEKANLPDSLEFLGIGAFAESASFSDTLRLPPLLKSYYIGTFASTSSVRTQNFESYSAGTTTIVGAVNHYSYHDPANQIVYIPKNVNYIADCDTVHYKGGGRKEVQLANMRIENLTSAMVM